MCVGLLVPAIIGGMVLFCLRQEQMDKEIADHLNDKINLMSISLPDRVWNVDTVSELGATRAPPRHCDCGAARTENAWQPGGPVCPGARSDSDGDTQAGAAPPGPSERFFQPARQRQPRASSGLEPGG